MGGGGGWGRLEIKYFHQLLIFLPFAYSKFFSAGFLNNKIKDGLILSSRLSEFAVEDERIEGSLDFARDDTFKFPKVARFNIQADFSKNKKSPRYIVIVWGTVLPLNACFASV
ncbi:MAG TPA: hypothetical protein PKZ29_02740 [Candidatus Woesebacteria bacterium]|nr:hypothetical protein [Candidatus Woesebacteria bacterium]